MCNWITEYFWREIVKEILIFVKIKRTFKEIKQIFANYDFKTQILVASIRHPQHVVDAGKIGADVVTLPAQVLAKMLGHSLTDKGLKAFLSDWEKLQSELSNKA